MVLLPFYTNAVPFIEWEKPSPVQGDPIIRVIRSGGTKDISTGQVTYNYVAQNSSSTVHRLECRGAGVNPCTWVTIGGINVLPGTSEFDIVKASEVAEELYFEYLACSSQFEKEIVLSVQDETTMRVYTAVLEEKEIGSVEIVVYLSRI
jgi:hypothetical protein